MSKTEIWKIYLYRKCVLNTVSSSSSSYFYYYLLTTREMFIFKFQSPPLSASLSLYVCMVYNVCIYVCVYVCIYTYICRISYFFFVSWFCVTKDTIQYFKKRLLSYTYIHTYIHTYLHRGRERERERERDLNTKLDKNLSFFEFRDKRYGFNFEKRLLSYHTHTYIHTYTHIYIYTERVCEKKKN